MGVGIILKSLLRDRKMTIKQLSEETGISLNTLYSITKRDSESIDPVILLRITTALGMSVDDFFNSAKSVNLVELFPNPGGPVQESDTLDGIDVAFYSDFRKLTDEDKETILAMVRIMRERQEKKEHS